MRVMLGGAFDSVDPGEFMADTRAHLPSYESGENVGFRLVRPVSVRGGARGRAKQRAGENAEKNYGQR